ncbi:MAG: TRAP transporter small permease subunit [Synechococcus sp. SB0668_bin_15]|nr:TRAP transporter small permease subunit [Synechococcus sp. SB0668_bin_15]MXZ82991.1 TRAP transporter small permease subunit [Synechococcus sp. SB0666_bin_14]MYC49143.1 TRAP transporter small permease subunit [Synechococcus sp. SB0662_bin_14]MYG47019.1 TRAP transporter small permease subunit [Synechococcus sp. SB0675_bin_6]MYJ59317.1 TRAP transporter small permease subunit [Synechococcus sp. SB0672_bin_6]MYK91610.1 TRAP transporter small permease subunit [Synechococcus sp. SB0669_bin_8]
MKSRPRLLRTCWPWLKRWAAAVDGLNSCVGRLAGVLVLLMLVVGIWNVAGRHLGLLLGHNLSSNRLIEVQWYLFAAAFLLGGPWTLQRNGHVRVDVLQSRWGARRQTMANLAGTLLFLLPFCLLMIASSWEAVWLSWHILEQSPDPGGLPRYPLKSILPLSFLLLALQGVAETIHNLDALRSGRKGRR